MANFERTRQAAKMIASQHNCTAYIYKRADNGEIVITITPKSETWLDGAKLELIETATA